MENEEREEKYLEVFTSVVAELSSLEKHLAHVLQISELSEWADQMMEKIQSCKSGLAFLRMFFMSHFKLDDTLEDIWGISTYKVLVFSSLENMRQEIGHWILDLEDKIQKSKLEFGVSCEVVLRYKPLKNGSTVEFLDSILHSLKDLKRFKTDDEILLLNNQITILEKKVTLLYNLFNFTHVQWMDFKEMQELQVLVRVFVQYSASLVLLYWVKEVDEEMATKLNILLFNVLQKYTICVPAFKVVYLRFLKEMKSKSMQLDSLLLGHAIRIFLDLLLESLVVHISKEEFQILQESLFFLISFLASPPDQDREDGELTMMTAEIEVLVKVDLYRVLSTDEITGNESEADTRLSDFLSKAELVKGKIQQVYVQIRDSFSYDFPKINGLGFFDFTLQNLELLKEKLKSDSTFIPFAKHLIIQIEEKLRALRPYLDGLFEQQKAQKEVKDTWLKVIELAYTIEYAINLCSVIGDPIWYNMARLMEVLDEITDVSSNVKKIISEKTHDDGANLHYLTGAPNRTRKSPWDSGFNEVIVGLKEELDKIVEKLKWGSKSLDVVAIVGMAGLGKTTMANKVYNSPAIRRHFHIVAYCIVSQTHNTRNMLLDILADIKEKDDKMSDMKEEELADMLRKSLKGRRYLIIMDDVWDVKAWNEVERSFPNDKNGSRVIFTTRIHSVALQAKKDCTLHEIRFLSEEESWELLRKRALDAEVCPLDFSEVGKMIAKKCKGLPLTIVLIGGLLATTERSLSWWNKISETIGSYVSTEGGMDVLELSYQHLPEHLKSCFLYFGAFEEDAIIRVNKLALLWIAEGFVQNSNRVNLKNVAYEYLSDLVDRSLVIAHERSSYGGIKRCRMHDLVHEFCRKKAQEENIFKLMVNNETTNSSSSSLHNPYRVYIHTKGKDVSDVTDIYPRIHSLLFGWKIHRLSDWKIRRYRYGRFDLTKLNLVQVMDLAEFGCDELFLKEMQSVVHLRFMSVLIDRDSISSSLTLNNLISNRWNLEVLIIHGDLYEEFTEALWNLTRLRYVHVLKFYLNNSGVRKREAFPQMVNLESFSSFHAKSTEDLQVLLQRSPYLRKLSLYCTGDKRLSINFPNLDSLSKLESLRVESVGEACLRSFNLLSCLKKLSISNSGLEWSYLRMISNIPCLEVLKLDDGSFVGPKWDMEDTEFPNLKYLYLRGLDFQDWMVYEESFHSLEVFIMTKCYKLNKIPSCFGEMLTLKRFEVYQEVHRGVATSVFEIQESQKDSGNEELQFIVNIYSIPRTKASWNLAEMGTS